MVASRSSVATWDGRRLPGPHLVRRAIEWAKPRAREHGSATVVIRRSHHIACLAAYLEPVARAGMLVEIYSSDPAVASVAPFGGTQAVFTPNPMAFGIPTSHDPILVDISASITTNGMSGGFAQPARTGEHSWWLDALGQPSRDPSVIFAQPPGTILPLGGLDAGHKGYGLALHGRGADGWARGARHEPTSPKAGAQRCWCGVTDPAAFGGSAEFTWQTDWIAEACRKSAPRDAAYPVRLPGERGLARKREQLAAGIALHPSIMPQLKPWSTRHQIATPEPFAP